MSCAVSSSSLVSILFSYSGASGTDEKIQTTHLFQRFISYSTVVPVKSDSGVMFCLQSYQDL